MTPTRTYSHWLAVTTIASVAICLGGGFVTTQVPLRAGLSVGAVMSLRFVLASIGMGLLFLVRREPVDRQSVQDGILLGLLLVAAVWLQTDGLRFTTTSKSGFITSLYIPFTPLLAIIVGEHVRRGHAIAAVLATLGLLLLIHLPGALGSGWNRGDLETLLCALFSAGHLVATTQFSRRSSGWVLAWMQIITAGVVSAGITAFLPAPKGFQRMAALHGPVVVAAVAYMVVFCTIYAFWGFSTMQAFLSSTEAAVVFSLEPVTAGIAGVYLMNEKLSAWQLAGAALIIVAMISAELPSMARSHRQRGIE